MDKLIVKYQLIFLAFVLAITTSLVVGISSTRNLSQNIVDYKTPNNLLQPISQYYNYRLALAESNDQTILQTIISPKNNELTSSENASSIPVIVYHGITEDPKSQDVTLSQFKSQMYALKNAGYNSISLDDYTLFLNGQKSLPQKSFLLTFDDGRKDSFYSADPILKALNYKATMFVITSHLTTENPYYLTTEELKRMQNSGRWEIGSHSHNAHELYQIDPNGTKGHFYSNKLWLKDKNRLETTAEFESRIKADLIESKIQLKNAGFETENFSFPFGDFGQYSQNFPEAESIVPYIAAEVYRNNFYQLYKSSQNKITSQNEFNSHAAFSKRISANNGLTGNDLTHIFEGSRQKKLPYSTPLNNPFAWDNYWGRLNIEDQSLLVSASPNTTGGAAFLIGSSHWQNYKASAFIQWLTGNTFSFHTRVVNSENYLTCDFSDIQVQISQKLNGQTTILKTQKLKKPFDPAGAKFTVTVSENTISCSIDDEEVLSSDKIDPILLSGGIGFSTWDKDFDNSAILVHNLEVTEVQLSDEQETKASKISQD